ncbi:hypothetical protein GCM10010168_26570 [Actinoplanes ianthinogenes]|uniref:Uncharacterized protein n=1 Tax=Actinoplanes ianthinogenes TaxID=122358 RepID=A0ABN6CST4_9ACTN|nr:hypothetical protein [Actinoplanes ianthinogenes]BCJ48297.1 hypothetical protein Aiant_89540 [Actinoplanes ianthinogenes]GGR07797.1 hypothetical protein GCM10010168_26570 [Actinoplanes ianthinogenes]
MEIGDLERAGGVFESDGFVDRANRSMITLFDRLDALPRSDAFWARTNYRATWYKLGEFARQCLARDPGDDVARWTLIAMSMQTGMYGGLALLAEQPSPSPEVVSDLLALSEHVWMEVGVPPGAELEKALLKVGPELLAQATEPAASAARAFLAGQPFAKALGRDRWEAFVDALAEDRRESAVERAREYLHSDDKAVDDLLAAARWWVEFRDTDARERLQQLLG